MTSQLNDEVYDLLIMVDSTYSMLNYLEALQLSLPKVIAISEPDERLLPHWSPRIPRLSSSMAHQEWHARVERMVWNRGRFTK